MKQLFSILFLFFFSGSIYADVFLLAGKKIEVSSPQGFTRITKEMDAVYRMSQQLADPMNKQLAFYITDSSIPQAKANKMPSLDRYFMLKRSKKLEGMVISSEQFTEIKDAVKSQNKKLYEDIKSLTSKQMKSMSKGVSKEFDIDFAMKLTKAVPYDPHYETDNVLAYSLVINYGGSVEGEKEDYIVSATATFVNLDGKVLFLFCYGLKEDIEWTRKASKVWVKTILAEN